MKDKVKAKAALIAEQEARIAAQQDLIFASVEIGGIVNMEYWALDGMAARTHNTGRQVRDLTVGELMDMLKAQQRFHARIEEKLTTKWRRHDQQG